MDTLLFQKHVAKVRKIIQKFSISFIFCTFAAANAISFSRFA